MTKNIGTNDYITRIVVGVIIATTGVYFQSWWGLIAIVPLATAFVGVCPAYLPFKLSTCKTEKAK